MKTTTLQAERRNLDYEQVKNTLSDQLKDYADNANTDGYAI